jgi:hypothetical protein
LNRVRPLRFAAGALLSGAAATAGAQPQEPATTSNFHAVGFDVDTKDDAAFTRSVVQLTQDCALIRLDDDDLVCLRQTDKGGQIWIGLREAGDTYEFVTANPGFVGKSAFPVTIEGVLSETEWEPFEYRLAVRFSEQQIPLLVSIADPREAKRFADLAEPVEMTLDVTAFTFNPEIFEDEAAFLAAQKKLGEDVTYAPDFFIPSGLFGDSPTARATFGGEILEAERVAASNGASHWRTLVKVQGGGTVNVVFDDVWPELRPAKGKLISGAFWLSAQVAGER